MPGKPPPRPGASHWRVVHAAKKQWAEYLAWSSRAQSIPRCVPGERRRVEVTFYRPGPVGDEDNTYASCKVPLDALVRIGVIEDDGPTCIDLEACSVSASPSRTVIRITRL